MPHPASFSVRSARGPEVRLAKHGRKLDDLLKPAAVREPDLALDPLPHLAPRAGADRVQLRPCPQLILPLAKLPAGKDIWDTDGVGASWGFDDAILGNGRTASGMTDADAEGLPFPGKKATVLVYRREGVRGGRHLVPGYRRRGVDQSAQSEDGRTARSTRSSPVRS